MKIELKQVGKKYIREWIFRHFSYTFEENNIYTIVGPNGSGKSTLLQIIAGSLTASEGEIIWKKDNSLITPEKIYSHISIVAPYIDIIEEMTPIEFLNFHSTFKPFFSNQTVSSILEFINLKSSSDKQIRYFSSGMKQRLKLAQAIFSETSLVLLDEPCTNLDQTGIELYYQLIHTYTKNRLVIISSNNPLEYTFCNKIISIQELKGKK